MKKLVLTLIRAYQHTGLFIGSCRYTPSCSNYTYQAVEKYGVLKGISLGALRIIRCNPLFKGGYDPLI